MANDDNKMCTLKFQSPGDFKSALRLAEKEGIRCKVIEQTSGETLMTIPARAKGLITSLGGINFGIKVWL